MHDDDFELLIDCDDLCNYPAGVGHVCSTDEERSPVRVDMEVAASPGWLRYAIGAALAGTLPRTTTYLFPCLTGGPALDLGRGPVARGMAFGGATHGARPQFCDLTCATVIEDAGDVVFDDFESMGWPAIRAPGGAA